MKNRGRGTGDGGRVLRAVTVAVCLTLPASPLPLPAQRPTYQQQMQDNQHRLEGIRRERSEAEQALERLRTQAHSLADESAHRQPQKQGTKRTANAIDPQTTGRG